VTNQSNTIFSVGDFWPDDLLSNKKGTQDVVLPTLADQVEGCVARHHCPDLHQAQEVWRNTKTEKLRNSVCHRYLAQNLVSEEDVFVLQAGEMLIQVPACCVCIVTQA
jgi:hypothetical protein